MSDSITCPDCRPEIPLTEAISHQVEARLRLEFEETQRAMESEHAGLSPKRTLNVESQLAEVPRETLTTAEARASEKVANELRDLSARAEEQASLRRDAEQRELGLLKEKRALQDEREALEWGRKEDLRSELKSSRPRPSASTRPTA